jgi:Flp pilus assembly protein TadG
MLSLAQRRSGPPASRQAAVDRRGVAAVEFGLICPVMVILTIGVFDLSKAGILWEQTYAAARSIAESASTAALQPDGSTSLSQAQAQEALSIIFAEMPWLRAGIATGPISAGNVPGSTVSAVLTSVSYAPNVTSCTASCTYTAIVQWSKAYSGYNFITGTSVLRPCVTLTPVAPTAPSSLTTAPISALSAALKSTNSNQPDPFLVADVSFKYTPLFFRYLLGPVTFKATAYWTTRSSGAGTSGSPWTTYSAPAGSDAYAVQCSS